MDNDSPRDGSIVLHEAKFSRVAGSFMEMIRPEWRARSLVERVQRLLTADPGSACQRLLNAAVHDLRQKIIIAGLDIAQQAATQGRFPPINKAEDAESYPTDKLLDLAYGMGILSRPEWRRLKRCYDIRRDLEHEDDEYEATLEDCVYIFKTCIEVVLSKDPVQLLRVVDVKSVVEQAAPFFPQKELLDDFAAAPEPRQLEILKFLIASALKEDNADIVKQNSAEMLKHLHDSVRPGAKLDLAKHVQERIGRVGLTLELCRIAHAAGVFPYLKESSRSDLFLGFIERLEKVGYKWNKFTEHQAPLEEIEDVGGLVSCPDGLVLQRLLRWMTMCYVGSSGGRTRYGHVRRVFYSDTAAPYIERLVAVGGDRVLRMLKELRKDSLVANQIASNKYVAARYEDLLDKAGDK